MFERRKQKAELMRSLAADIQAAIREKERMERGSEEYMQQITRIEKLSEAYYKLADKHIDWAKIFVGGATIAATLAQTFMIYKIERDGYLIRNNTIKLQMPKA